MKRRYCLLCEDRLDQNPGWNSLFRAAPPVLCELCSGQMERMPDGGCEGCGHPCTAERCEDCTAWNKNSRFPPVAQRSLYMYSPFVQEVLSRFKYRGDAELSGIFSRDLYELARRKYRGFQTVVPVPLHAERLWERGFNQAALLAEGFRSENLLERTRMRPKQSKSTGIDRKHNTEGAFILKDKAACTGKHILLIDDIYTTGATLQAAAVPFWEAGAAGVSAVTAARAIKRKEIPERPAGGRGE